MRNAMGLLETYGAVGAYVGADAALKAASVHLVSKTYPSGGLVTILLEGDVSAIQAAIEAGVAAVAPLNIPITSHVIPSVSTEVAEMVKPTTGHQGAPSLMEEAAETPATVLSEVSEITTATSETASPATTESAAKEAFVTYRGEQYAVYQKGRLDTLKVVALREISRKLSLQPENGRRIQDLSKQQLIAAIRQHMKGGEAQ